MHQESGYLPTLRRAVDDEYGEQQKVLLLLDRAGGHIHHETKRVMSGMRNFDFEYIEEGTTSRNQPLDASVFGGFKVCFRATFRRLIAQWKHEQRRNVRNQYTLGVHEYRRFIIEAIGETQRKLLGEDAGGMPARIRKCFRQLGYTPDAAEADESGDEDPDAAGDDEESTGDNTVEIEMDDDIVLAEI